MTRELNLAEIVIIVIAVLSLANLSIKNVGLEKTLQEERKISSELNEEVKECRGSNDNLIVLLAAFKNRLDKINEGITADAGKK